MILITRMFLIIVLCAQAALAARVSLFLLGDSTSRRLYTDALAPSCSGFRDPLATRVFEINGCSNNSRASTCIYNEKPLVCSPESPLARIGYTIHWGLSPPPYHVAWSRRRSLGDTDDSVTNILDSVAEFQARSPHESAVFVLVSNIWTVKRYADHNFNTTSPVGFVAEFEQDAWNAINRIHNVLRPTDALVLSTTHVPYADLASFSLMINEAFRRLAHRRGLELFDEAALFDAACAREYLADDIHQTPEASATIASALVRFVVHK